MEGVHQQLGELNVDFKERWGLLLSLVGNFRAQETIAGLSGLLTYASDDLEPYIKKYKKLLSKHRGKKYSHLVTDDIRRDLSYVESYVDKLNGVNAELVQYGLIGGESLRTSSRSGRRRSDRVAPSTDTLVDTLLSGQSRSCNALLSYLENFEQVVGTSPTINYVRSPVSQPLVVSSTSVDIVVSANNNNDGNTASITQQLSREFTSGTGTVNVETLTIPPEPTSADVSANELSSDDDDEDDAVLHIEAFRSFFKEPVHCQSSTVDSTLSITECDTTSAVSVVSSSINSVSSNSNSVNNSGSDSFLGIPGNIWADWDGPRNLGTVLLLTYVYKIMNKFIYAYGANTAKSPSSVLIPCRKPFSPITYLYSADGYKLALPQCWAKPCLRIDEYISGSSIIYSLDDKYNRFRSNCFSRCTDRHESYCFRLLLSCIGRDRECDFQHHWPLSMKSNNYSWPCGCIQPLGRELATSLSPTDTYLNAKAWVTIDDKPYRYIATFVSKSNRKAKRRIGSRLYITDGKKGQRDGRRRKRCHEAI